tara:strand:- start:41 stop:1333 length:1293 start_codon:yes stop_codon:yes gene_type:complete
VIKFITIASLILFTNCSLDTRSGIWTKEKKIEEVETKYFKVLKKKLVRKKEFNPNFKINLSKSYSLKSNDLSNNLLIKDFNRNINKSSKFRFSKIKNFDYFEPELVFDGKNFIFFDDKGSLIKFNDNFKIVWKKNFYTKQEKKLKPILTLSSDQKYLVVFDNVAKYYAIDLISGNLIWSKKNKNPFNSQVKIFNKKIYAIDMNNIVRCISLIDGSEIWNFKSENTFLKSPKRNSLIIKNDIVYFNNSLGDIIAISAIDGKLIWQTPTQSSLVYENAFNLILSDLVASKNELIFSNNRNEFFSLSLNNGIPNWKQNINSNIRPIFYNDLIFTISNEGYFFVINSLSGDIIRITDVFKIFKEKIRDTIKPIGFISSLDKLLLSTNNGRLLTIDISSGKTVSILKIDNEKISRPFVFDKKLLLIKNNSIIRLN